MQARRLHGLVSALAFVASVAGLGLLFWGGFLMHPLFAFEHVEAGLGYALLGALLLGVGLWQIGVSPSLRVPPMQERAPRWNVFWLGVVALLVVVHYNIFLLPSRAAALDQHVQVVLLLGGWGACWWALLGGGLPRLPRLRLTWQSALFVLIMAFAAWARLVDLEEGIHRFVDEVHFAKAVGDLLYFPDVPILMPHGGVTMFTWLYPYGQLWTTLLTGGASLTGLRLMSVLLGLAQVAGVYVLLRLGFDRITALVGMAVLASFPPHLHLSRIGLNNIADPTFAVWAFIFALLALRHNRQRDYVLAGACLGLTHYFYEGGRAFYTVFMLLWLGWLWLTSARRRVPYGLWYGIAAFVVTVLPMYYVWITNEVSLLPRVDATARDLSSEIAQGSLRMPVAQVVWEGVRALFLAYVHFPDNSSFYRSDTGYVLPLLVPFFLVGLAACAWRARRAGDSLLLWWVLAVPVANYAIGTMIFVTRYAVGFVAVATVVAVGMVTVTRLLGRLRWFAPLAQPVLTLLVVAAMVGQADYYLNWHLPQYYHRQFYYEYDQTRGGVPVKDYDDMLFRAVKLPSPVDVHVIARGVQGQIGFGAVLAFYGRHRPEDLTLTFLYVEDLSERYLARLPRTRTQAFFLEPEDNASLVLLRRFFTLSAPQVSPHNIPPERQLLLYVADVLDNINR